MIFGSVCSGIEAASVAWEPLGWRAAFLSEIDPFPRAVLAHRFPRVPLRGDFTEIKWGEHDAIDLLVGGTPCQSFSIAGLRKGLGDQRGNLALEFLRLADRLRPGWVVWENVPGVLSSSGGRDFGAFLGGLAELGYGWAYRVLDAQYVRVGGFSRAVPQRRRRVFVVGYSRGWAGPAAVLFDRDSLSGNPAPRREARKGHPGAGPVCSGGGRQSGSVDVATALAAHGQRLDWEAETFVAEPVAFSCKDYGADCSVGVSPTLRSMAKNGGHANGGGQVAVADPVAFDWQSGGDCRGLDPKPVAMLQARQTPAVAFQERAVSEKPGIGPQGAGFRLDGAAYTLKARHRPQSAYDGWRVRRLTPTECERLQGFPDGWTAVPYRGRTADACPDGPRYKAIGNSMAVNVMRWIGERIALVDEIIKREDAA